MRNALKSFVHFMFGSPTERLSEARALSVQSSLHTDPPSVTVNRTAAPAASPYACCAPGGGGTHSQAQT